MSIYGCEADAGLDDNTLPMLLLVTAEDDEELYDTPAHCRHFSVSSCVSQVLTDKGRVQRLDCW